MLSSLFTASTIILASFLTSSAYCRVVSLSSPVTAVGGTNITAVLGTESYIENWDDFGVIWGLVESYIPCDECSGELLTWTNIYGNPAFPLDDGSYNVTITLPNMTGPFSLTASIPYLVGASGMTGFTYLVQNITLE